MSMPQLKVNAELPSKRRVRYSQVIRHAKKARLQVE